MKVIILLAIIASVSPLRSNNIKYVGMKNIGKYIGVNDEGIVFEKSYYISQYLKATPINARSACKSHGSNFDLATFETREEFLKIKLNLNTEIDLNRDIGSNKITVGGFVHKNANGKSDYYWIFSGAKVDFHYDAANKKDMKCLALQKEGAVAFAQIECEEKYLFICQEVEFQYSN